VAITTCQGVADFGAKRPNGDSDFLRREQENAMIPKTECEKPGVGAKSLRGKR